MNSLNPKISIVVPVYNVEKYVIDCIDSVVNQSLKEIEIIIVNDESEDNSINLVKNHFVDNRIKIVEQKNKGLSEARNTGLKISRGEYILFVDSDDYIDTNMCKELYENNCGGDIIFSNYYANYGNRKDEFNFSDKLKKYFEINLKENIKYDGKLIYERSLAAVWDKLYRRTFLIENNLYFTPKILHEDLNFSLKAFFLAEGIYYRDHAYYYYWQNNSSGIINSMKKEKEIASYEKIIEDLENFYIILKDQFKKLRVILIISQYKLIIFKLKNQSLSEEEIGEILLQIRNSMDFELSNEEAKIIKHELSLLLNMRPLVENIKVKEVLFFRKGFNFFSLGIKLLRRKLKIIFDKVRKKLY